jgi:hypothetical protein
MTRVYRLFVEVRIEGDADTLPTMDEMVEEVTTLVADATNHDLAVRVVAIEIDGGGA